LSLIKKTLLLSAIAASLGIGIIYLVLSLFYFSTNQIKTSTLGLPVIITLIILLGLLFATIIVLFLQVSVFSRIRQLETQFQYLADNDDYDVTISLEGNDELSGFANRINKVITTKRITDKALRESELFYKTIFEASADAFVIIDKDFYPVSFNRKFSIQFGFDDDDLKQKDLISAVIKSDSTTVSQIRNSGFDKIIGPVELQAIKKNGERLLVNLLSSPVKLKENNFILLRFTDITTIKELEAKAKEQQLLIQQADKLASLGLLVSGVAHEINNPISFISFNLSYIEKSLKEIFPNLDLIAKDKNDFKIGNLKYDIFKQEMNDLLKDLNEGSNRIINIVSDLKNFAKIEPEHERMSFSLKEITDSTLRLINHQIIKKHIEVKSNIDESFSLFGNKQKTGQVLINVITNAIDAVETITGKIIIDCRSNDDGDVLYSIADNGCGMDEETLNKVFDPFFTTKTNSGGTGLGLSVSKSIMENMGFVLFIKTELNKGTTVSLQFPKEFVK
jgi:PAS domain S-box-containing protein